jgi:hypothetical protein
MRSLIHRCMACLLTGAMLFASIGIAPVWLLPPERFAGTSDSDEWFPCKGHHCGCRNAEMCRAHCCCYPVAVAPAPQPAVRSCCTHEQAGAHKPVVSLPATKTASPGLAIRSAECAGLGAFWVMQYSSFGLVPQLERFSLYLPMNQDTLDTQVAAVHDQTNLSPEPHPPPAC